MSFLIFKFTLPILLGYTLFVGISGRFVPFFKPAKLSNRPSWFFGLWTGVSVALVAGIAMHMTMLIPIDKITTLARPTGSLLVGLLAIGVFGYFLYRREVTDELRYQSRLNRSADEMIAAALVEIESKDKADLPVDNTVNPNLAEETGIVGEQNNPVPEINLSEPAIASQKSGQESGQESEEIVDSGDLGSVSLLFDKVSTPNHRTEELQSIPVESTIESTEAHLINNDTVNTELTDIQSELTETQSALTGKQAELTEIQSELTDERSKLTQTQSVLSDNQAELTKKHSDNVELTTLVEQLAEKLTSETKMRSQTETHLRITRKALKNLERDARDFEIAKANAVIAVEVQLESHVKETASSTARANREETKRLEAQNKIVELTQDLLQSKRELRQSTEARARALSTANKSVAFARRNVQARSRAEARVKLLESRLKRSQQALKSRSAALSSEKRFNQAVGTRIKRKLISHREKTDG